MTDRTITRMFDNHDDAVAVVRELETAGFGHDHISIVANNTGKSMNETRYRTTDSVAADAADAGGAGAGATAGTIFGGGLGLLAGIGSMAIPGVGPVVAAGWLVATLTGAGVGAAVGAAGGGLVSSLTHAGVPEQDAHVYAEGVRRGGSLVTARVDELRVTEAERILDGRGHVDPAVRRSEYEQAGWKSFDDKQPPYTIASTTSTSATAI